MFVKMYKPMFKHTFLTVSKLFIPFQHIMYVIVSYLPAESEGLEHRTHDNGQLSPLLCITTMQTMIGINATVM